MKRSTYLVLLTTALLLAISAAAQAGDTKIQPTGDDRCLGPISGGFSLEACGAGNAAAFNSPGLIDFSGVCVSVPVATPHEQNPWKNGTRLKKTSCSSPEASSIDWRFDNGLIRSADPEHGDKCLTIEGQFHSMRATIRGCDEQGITRWRLN